MTRRTFRLIVRFTALGRRDLRHFLWSAEQFEDEIAFAVLEYGGNGPIDITVRS